LFIYTNKYIILQKILSFKITIIVSDVLEEGGGETSFYFVYI